MSWQCICSACGFFIQGHTTSRVCTPRPIIEFHLSMGSTSSQAPGFHPKHIDMFQMWIQTYSWWFRNPVNSPVELGSLSTIIYRDFIHPRWLFGISESSTVSMNQPKFHFFTWWNTSKLFITKHFAEHVLHDLHPFPIVVGVHFLTSGGIIKAK